MKGGLRLQLLLLLGGLMLLSYAPLFFATSAYTRLGLERLQRDHAERLGRSVAAQLADLRAESSNEEFYRLTRFQIERNTVDALSILTPSGESAAVLGDLETLSLIGRQEHFGAKPEVRNLLTAHGPAVLVYEPGSAGGVAAVVRVDAEVTKANPLAALMGLYMIVGAVGLMIGAYFALTRWIIRPILLLERQAERVAQGAREIEPLSQAPRELNNLSWRLFEMTNRLREEENALRQKISEVEARTEELKNAQASLVRSERLATVGRLAAGLAHEVGNPISALMGLQDLMIDGGLSDEEQADFLKRMRKETTRIHRVISDLLAYARPSGEGSRGLSPGSENLQGRASLSTALETVLALLTPQPDWSEMKIEQELAADLPSVPLSHEEITQIFLNLLMNAADASERKGQVHLSAVVENEMIIITVQDDGPGIPPELVDSLFDPFVSSKDVGKGTGLGLSVTKGLVESVGGTIHVESPGARGARFVITLPALER